MRLRIVVRIHDTVRLRMDEDWEVLRSFLPDDWQEMAKETGALKGLRKDKSVETLLRVLLLHLGCGHSLRETVVRARQADLADFSSVALFKRLKKSADWLRALCVELFQEQGMALSGDGGFQVRVFDATTVKEPGKTGSLWRIHYSVCLPSLSCDFFKITQTQGAGTGESFSQFPIRKGDHILADRGYSTAAGLHHVVCAGGQVTVRVNTGALSFRTTADEPFDLLAAVASLKRTGAVGAWSVETIANGDATVKGRVCAIRKTREAVEMAHEKIRREAVRKGKQVQPQTLEFARYVIVFTTFSEDSFAAREILEWYRVRWQVELVFKRFKSLAQLGHLPKYDDESARAWLYGKLLVALLVEKLIHHACAISPWGYDLEAATPTQRVA